MQCSRTMLPIMFTLPAHVSTKIHSQNVLRECLYDKAPKHCHDVVTTLYEQFVIIGQNIGRMFTQCSREMLPLMFTLPAHVSTKLHSQNVLKECLHDKAPKHCHNVVTTLYEQFVIIGQNIGRMFLQCSREMLPTTFTLPAHVSTKLRSQNVLRQCLNNKWQHCHDVF